MGVPLFRFSPLDPVRLAPPFPLICALLHPFFRYFHVLFAPCFASVSRPVSYKMKLKRASNRFFRASFPDSDKAGLSKSSFGGHNGYVPGYVPRPAFFGGRGTGLADLLSQAIGRALGRNHVWLGEARLRTPISLDFNIDGQACGRVPRPPRASRGTAIGRWHGIFVGARRKRR